MVELFKITVSIALMITLVLSVTMLAYILITTIRDDYLSRKENAKNGKK